MLFSLYSVTEFCVDRNMDMKHRGRNGPPSMKEPDFVDWKIEKLPSQSSGKGPEASNKKQDGMATDSRPADKSIYRTVPQAILTGPLPSMPSVSLEPENRLDEVQYESLVSNRASKAENILSLPEEERSIQKKPATGTARQLAMVPTAMTRPLPSMSSVGLEQRSADVQYESLVSIRPSKAENNPSEPLPEEERSIQNKPATGTTRQPDIVPGTKQPQRPRPSPLILQTSPLHRRLSTSSAGDITEVGSPTQSSAQSFVMRVRSVVLQFSPGDPSQTSDSMAESASFLGRDNAAPVSLANPGH